MMSSGTVVALGLVGLGAAGTAAAAGAASARRQRPYLPGSHAERAHALRDPLGPLRLGYASMHVAVRLDEDGRLRLGADDPDPARTLRRLVLAPLLARGPAPGRPSVREPLCLLVELLGDPDRTYTALDAQLRAHAPLLTRYRAGCVTPGPVTVLLTDAAALRRRVAAQDDRYAFLDGTFGDIGAAHGAGPGAPPRELVPLVSENMAWRFGWDGRGDMPAEERHLLRVLVRAAHADARRVRFFGVPERPHRVRSAFWRELHAAGVDLIGSSDLTALPRFLREQATGRRTAWWRRYTIPGRGPG
jgi:hypothetical protein